jgi:DNA (cytosine-5)-methyltransferase 1
MKKAELAEFDYHEHFCGGGMVRAGLGVRWLCRFACDIDKLKAWSYADNWGRDVLRVCDIATLEISDLPATVVDLSSASSPCQDLSLAGGRAGLGGRRSRAFWDWWRLVEGQRAIGCAPRMVLLENVPGLLTSNGGADLALVRQVYDAADYDSVVVTIDAARFTPQSRPRVFVIGVQRSLGIDIASYVSTALGALPPRGPTLASILDPRLPWHSAEETAEILAQMEPRHAAKIARMRQAGCGIARTYFKRGRRDERGNRISVVEVRDDDIAGTLRTAGGGSSIEGLIAVKGESMRTRLLSPRECARLQGLPDTYRLPANTNVAYDLVGDGVCTLVVRHLAQFVFEPILRSIRT